MAKRLLNSKQMEFVKQYVTGKHRGNATKSYIAAGYSPKTADVNAAILIGKHRIQAEIEDWQARLAEKAEISMEKVLAELKIPAFFDFGLLFDDRGKLLQMHKMPPEARQAIKSYKIRETRWGTNIEVTLHDKLGALSEIARILGFVKKATDPEIERAVQNVIIFKDSTGQVLISNDPKQFGSD